MRALPRRARCAAPTLVAAAFCAVLVLAGVLAVFDDLGSFLLQPDFAVYYLAARADAAGGSVYSEPLRAELARELPPGAYAGSTWYVYPPIFAAAVRPLAAMPFPAAAAVWLAANAGLMGIVTFHLLRLFRWRRRAAFAGAVGSLLLPGAQQTLLHGQVNWLPLAAIVFCLRDWSRPRSERGGGVLLGVASALKLFPLLLIAAAPPGRRTRTLLLAIGGAIATITAGVLTGGGVQLLAWVHALAAHSHRNFVDEVSNQGFAAVLARAGHGYGNAAAVLSPAIAAALGGTVPALALAATLAVAWSTPPRRLRRVDCGVRATALVAAALVALPAAWDHYHALLVPGAVVLLFAARRSRFAWTLYIAGAVLLVSHRFWRPLFELAPTHLVLTLGLAGTVAWWAACMWLMANGHRRAA